MSLILESDAIRTATGELTFRTKAFIDGSLKIPADTAPAK